MLARIREPRGESTNWNGQLVEITEYGAKVVDFYGSKEVLDPIIGAVKGEVLIEGEVDARVGFNGTAQLSFKVMQCKVIAPPPHKQTQIPAAK